MIKFIWTEDAVDLLLRLGCKTSACEIANLLGTTRNAVIGKAWREKIPLRDCNAASHSPETEAKRSASQRARHAARRAAALAPSP